MKRKSDLKKHPCLEKYHEKKQFSSLIFISMSVFHILTGMIKC